MVQRYNRIFNYVFKLRFYMFNLRDLTDFKLKFTIFKHFGAQKCGF